MKRKKTQDFQYVIIKRRKILLSRTLRYIYMSIMYIKNKIKTLQQMRLPLVLQGILNSPYFSTLLIHSTFHERKRTQAVDALESPVTKVLVCGRSFQE